MTTWNRVLVLCLAATPSLALASPPAASPGTFHTTGGQTQLSMKVLATTPTSMKVRFADPTGIAFGKQKTMTATFHREGSAASGWKSFAAYRQNGALEMSMTMEDKALDGNHGLVGLGMTTNGMYEGGVKGGSYFQLAGALKKK